MPQGLQILDASGNVIIDGSRRLGRILNVVTLTGATDGNETNAGLAGGSPFWQVVFLGSYATFMPTITVIGSTIYWAWDGRGAGNSYRLVYGVY